VEAEELKNITVRGRRTKVVAVGIGSRVDFPELFRMGSIPKDRNVLDVQNFRSLYDVKEEVRDSSCSGLLSHYK